MLKQHIQRFHLPWLSTSRLNGNTRWQTVIAEEFNSLKMLSHNAHLCCLFNFQEEGMKIIWLSSQHFHFLWSTHLETGFGSLDLQLLHLLLKMCNLQSQEVCTATKTQQGLELKSQIMFLQHHQHLWLYRKSRKFFLHSNRKEYPIFPEQQLKLKMTEQDIQTASTKQVDYLVKNFHSDS